VSYPLGAEPEGIIMYTPDGYMSAQLMARGRGLYSDRDPHMANTDELAQPAACYLSYSGPFTVERTVVAHHVQTSLMPNRIGQTQYRAAQLDATNTLTLRPNRARAHGRQTPQLHTRLAPTVKQGPNLAQYDCDATSFDLEAISTGR
jgi:hypothetical protein